MKNKLILDGQAFKNVLRAVLFVALGVMGLVEAKNVGQQRAKVQQAGARPGTRAGQPVRRGGGRVPVRTQRGAQPNIQQGQQPVVGPTLEQPAVVIPTQGQSDQTLQDKVSDLISQPFTPQIGVQIRTILSNSNLSDKQRASIENYLRTQKLLQAMQAQIEELKQRQISAMQPLEGKVVIEKAPDKGWFYNLTGYELPELSGWQKIGAGLAAGMAAPYLAPYVLTWGAFQAATALVTTGAAVNQIKFSYERGAITTAGAVENRKNLLRLQLASNPTWPTDLVRIKALSSPTELLALGEKVGDKIFDGARESLIIDIQKQTLPQAIQDAENNINNEINKCRRENGAQDGATYIANINRVADMPKYRAYVSEVTRMTNILEGTVLRQAEQESEAGRRAQAVEEAKAAVTGAVGAVVGGAAVGVGQVAAKVAEGYTAGAKSPATTPVIVPAGSPETPLNLPQRTFRRPEIMPQQRNLTPPQQMPPVPVTPGPKVVTQPPALQKVTPVVLPEYPSLEEKPVASTQPEVQAPQEQPASGQQQAGKKNIGLVGKGKSLVSGIWENLPSGY